MAGPSADASAAANRGPVGDRVWRRDPLTGLHDRDYLSALLHALLADATEQQVPATLALLQLENFYEIRRWVGRPEADLLLSDIAKLLIRSLPDSVVLCRCEHYEFAALLRADCSINARLVTDRVKQALLHAVSAVIPPQLELKCAVGLARLDTQTPSADVLFAKARHRLSTTIAGADTYPHWQPDDKEYRANLQNIRHGIRNAAFTLNFQPIVSIQGDDRRRYEIRCRMPGSRPAMQPAILFEIAVHNGLGGIIDRWILRCAIDLLRQQQDLQLTVNLTQNSLVEAGFFSWLARGLRNDNSVASRLCVQISEIDVLIAQHHMAFVSEQLQTMQVQLCIKHFGCTENPFRYLPLLVAHQVRLDSKLLDNLLRDSQQRENLSSLVREIRGHGLRASVSQIEDMRLLPLLWQARVNFVQGCCMQAPGTRLDFRFAEDIDLGAPIARRGSAKVVGDAACT